MPTKTDDKELLDALYEKEVPPSTWDDHQELDEAPGDNFAPWGADKDAGARLQFAELDQRYQAAIDGVVAKLTAVEADPTLASPASREALVWLGENTALLGYFLGGTAAAITHNALALEMGRHRGMYRPPQASADASAARGLLHNRLMALLTNESLGTEICDLPELREAMDRIVRVARASYIDHLGRQFADTKNPAYAWYAVRLVLTHKVPFPDWLCAYLANCADQIYKEGEKEEVDKNKKKKITPTSHARICQIFGFANPDNSNRLFGLLSAVRSDMEKAPLFSEKERLKKFIPKPDAIINEITEASTVVKSTVVKRISDIEGRIRTDKPYEQDV